MRELTKSMLRMSWALPLFGIKQMTHLALPTKASQERAAEAFDALSDAAQRELGSAFGGLHDAGDRLQRGVVDATFGVFLLDLFDPGRWLPGGGAGPAQPGTPPPDAHPAPAAAEAPSPAAPAPQSAPSGQLGWGPMRN